MHRTKGNINQWKFVWNSLQNDEQAIAACSLENMFISVNFPLNCLRKFWIGKNLMIEISN